MIEESAIEFEGEDVNEEEIVNEFKQFLDHVTPDEFAEAADEDELAVAAPDLALGEVEDLLEDLLEAVARERAAVRAGSGTAASTPRGRGRRTTRPRDSL